jgi:hypothetical protein
VNLTSPISTKDSKAGDTFTAVVLEPAEFQNSVIEGHVRKVEPAQNVEAPKSHISFAFETLTLTDNTTYKIEAVLKDVTNSKGVATVDEEGQAIAQNNAGNRAKAGFGGAGLGAFAGGMLGGTMGSAIGAAAGGALGYAISLEVTASSHNIEFYPGTHFTLDVSSKGVDKDANAVAVRQLESTNEAAMAAHSASVGTDQQPSPDTNPTPQPMPAPQPAPSRAPVAESSAAPQQ